MTTQQTAVAPSGSASFLASSTPIILFGAASFLSAFLLFWVQPLYSKMILPLLGGSPSVWNTAMMFFQLMLLAGYGYAHFLTRWGASLRWQVGIHGAVLAFGLLFLPLAVSPSLAPPTGSTPIYWLVGLFAVSVGWPFFALSASAPLLQAWFARNRHRFSSDPYFLYSASNFGSLLALLSFPVLLEPRMALAGQSNAWTLGYECLLALFVIVGLFRLMDHEPARHVPIVARSISPAAPGLNQRLTWVALAFVPSSLLLGVTTYITTDIASVPLLWIVPLALYLMSFIVAFARNSISPAAWTLKLQAIAVVVVATLLMLLLIFGMRGSVILVMGAHLLAFAATALVCHIELARRRPAAENLTSFYFCMSIGGAAGGVFNALVAPLIFSSDYEYYLALIAACALRSLAGNAHKPFSIFDMLGPLLLAIAVAAMAYGVFHADRLGLVGRLVCVIPCAVALYSFADRPLRFALGVAAVMGTTLVVHDSVGVLATERNFFGINKVKLSDDGRETALIHGTTMHGTEFTDPALQREPLAYYARSGPVGQIFALSAPRPNVAVIGLGAGALACYRRPGDSWTFFEIDSAVEQIARDTRYFHYLADCGGNSRVVIGDGRLSLKRIPDAQYDLIVIDAFSWIPSRRTC